MANQLLIKSGDKMPKQTIEQRINSFCLNEDLSDVCFLVGDERAKVHAHRFILAAGSEVFRAMFYGELKETRNEIEVPDLTLVGFRNMIKYFYTTKVEIDLSEVHPTYLAANKYLAFDLIQDLSDYLKKSCSDVSNICLAYDQLLKLEIGDSLCDIENQIATRFSAACVSDSFKQISEDSLVSILNFSKLNVREVELLKACMRWTDGRVVRQDSEANKASKRATFEPIKHLIRFADISLSDFSSISGLGSYLTAEEIGEIFLQLSHQRSSTQIDYRSPRATHFSKASVAKGIASKKGFLYADDIGFVLVVCSISVNKKVRISLMQTFPSSNCLSLKFDAFNNKGKKTLSVRGKTVTGQQNDNSVCWLIDLSELNFVLEPNVNYKINLFFMICEDSNSGTYPNSIGISNEMTLKSDESEAIFKIEPPGYNLHIIESIVFELL